MQYALHCIASSCMTLHCMTHACCFVFICFCYQEQGQRQRRNLVHESGRDRRGKGWRDARRRRIDWDTGRFGIVELPTGFRHDHYQSGIAQQHDAPSQSESRVLSEQRSRRRSSSSTTTNSTTYRYSGSGCYSRTSSAATAHQSTYQAAHHTDCCRIRQHRGLSDQRQARFVSDHPGRRRRILLLGVDQDQIQQFLWGRVRRL